MPPLTRKLSHLISRRKKSKPDENQRQSESESESERERERSKSPFRITSIFSGSAISPGQKLNMEGKHICIDNLSLCVEKKLVYPAAYYGVFDGHGGSDSAAYAQLKLVKYIVNDLAFPDHPEKAISNAFTAVDNAIHLTGGIFDGTTALVALVLGKTLYVANAGDSRAVLVNNKKFVIMSREHKPTNSLERHRIETNGGFVDAEGLLNSRLSVSRSLGDWDIKRALENSPLISDPEIEVRRLQEEDEFLIMASHGVWDVVSCMDAVRIVGKALVSSHGDLNKAVEALMNEAIENKSKDNLTVLVVLLHPSICSPSSWMRRCFCLARN